MQLGKFFNRNWVVLTIVMLVVGAGVGSFAATFEYGINPTNNRPNANTGQGYISTSRDSRLFNKTEIQKAIDYVNNESLHDGVVHLPSGVIASTGFTIENCTVVGHGTVIRFTSNDAGITVYPFGKLHDVRVNVSSGYTGTAVHVVASPDTIQNFVYQQDVLRNVYIRNEGVSVVGGTGSATGIGLNISSVSNGAASGDNRFISKCSFNEVSVIGFEYGFIMYADEIGGSDSHLNSNTFNNIFISFCKHAMWVNTSNADANINHNMFTTFIVQGPGVGGIGNSGINFTGRCNGFRFRDIQFWDWTYAGGATVAFGPFSGKHWFNGFVGLNSGYVNYTDGGTSSTIIDVNGDTTFSTAGSFNVVKQSDNSSLFKRYEYINPHSGYLAGASGGQAVKGYNGVKFDATNEYGYYSTLINEDWDEQSDISIQVVCWLRTAEAVNDYVNITMQCNLAQPGENVASEDSDQVLVNEYCISDNNAQYESFSLNFTLDYDAGGNVVERGDVFGFYINAPDIGGAHHVSEFTVSSIIISYSTPYPQVEDL